MVGSARLLYRIDVPSLSLAWPAATASMSHGCGANSNAGPSLSLPGGREQQPWAIVAAPPGQLCQITEMSE